jgi:hypothetical protein
MPGKEMMTSVIQIGVTKELIDRFICEVKEVGGK